MVHLMKIQTNCFKIRGKRSKKPAPLLKNMSQETSWQNSLLRAADRFLRKAAGGRGQGRSRQLCDQASPVKNPCTALTSRVAKGPRPFHDPGSGSDLPLLLQFCSQVCHPPLPKWPICHNVLYHSPQSESVTLQCKRCMHEILGINILILNSTCLLNVEHVCELVMYVFAHNGTLLLHHCRAVC